MSDETGSLLVDEGARRRFEAAWREGRPRPIEEFLPAGDHPQYRGTLEELIHIELELAWKATRDGAPPPLVEDYLRRFPALESDGVVLRLLRQEYLVRLQNGDRPSPEEYRRRFPQLVASGGELEPT